MALAVLWCHPPIGLCGAASSPTHLIFVLLNRSSQYKWPISLFIYLIYYLNKNVTFLAFYLQQNPHELNHFLTSPLSFLQTSTCLTLSFLLSSMIVTLKSPLLCKVYGEVKSYSLNQINQMNVDQSYMWTSETGTAAFLVLSCNVYRAEGQRSDEA